MQAPSNEMIDVDIAIVGAGPAGLSAALYAARANRTLVVLQGKEPPALAKAHLIANYAGVKSVTGDALLSTMREQVTDLGVRVIEEDAIALILGMTPKGVTTRTKLIQAKAVIIATGRGSRKTTVKNEAELLGRGVSYCALCDGPLYRQKDVVIYGADEEALEDALALAQMGCKVSVVFEGPLSKQNPQKVTEIQKRTPPIQLIDEAKVVDITKNEAGNVAAVKIVDKDKKEQTLETRALFIISHVSAGSLLRQAGVAVSDKGCVPTNAKQETNLEGVYAAGDVACGEQQVAVAVGQGAVAGIEAARYVRSMQS